ncbi:unnamed protein product [Pedinophyceae sp. YPF-701]|nr:unnamed protein product [Pedinophyceae sp. YPF-701]
MLLLGHRLGGWLALLLLIFARQAGGQISKPIAADSNVDTSRNKFLQRDADAGARPSASKLMSDRCDNPQLQLKWMTELSSSVYTTPLITDLFGDGTKDVVANTFVKYVEVVDGRDGSRPPGFPAKYEWQTGTSHSSPLLFDIDFDGVKDILIGTYDGEISFVKDTGDRMYGYTIYLPRLKVDRLWWQDLAPDPVRGATLAPAARAPPPAGRPPGRGRRLQEVVEEPLDAMDVEDGEVRGEEEEEVAGGVLIDDHDGSTKEGLKHYEDADEDDDGCALDGSGCGDETEAAAAATTNVAPTAQQVPQGVTATPRPPQGAQPTQRAPQAAQPTRQMPQGAQPTQQAPKGAQPTRQVPQGAQPTQQTPQGAQPTRQMPQGAQPTQQAQQAVTQAAKPAAATPAPARTAAAAADAGVRAAAAPTTAPEPTPAARVLGRQDAMKRSAGAAAAAGVQADEFAREEEEAAAAEKRQEMGVADRMAAAGEGDIPVHPAIKAAMDDWDMVDRGPRRGDDEDADLAAERAHEDLGMRQDGAPTPAPSPFVNVDSHVLATPALHDLNGDGIEELIVPVSHFFDRDYYSKQRNKWRIPAGTDISKYIASAVVAISMRTRHTLWHAHLDLTTEDTKYASYVYATPVVADVDGDGAPEVVLGTGSGHVHVLDRNGESKAGWPQLIGQVQGQALVADLNGDGALEILVADAQGSVVCFAASGAVLWDRHFGTAFMQGAVGGDVDGDGQLDVVLGSASGRLFALRGKDGSDLDGFPYAAGDRIMAVPLLMRMADTRLPGLGSVVTERSTERALRASHRKATMSVIFPSFDGYLHVVNPASECVELVDIGEASYSMVLADDVDNDGMMDLIVSTMNGNLYCFGTRTPFRPLRSWTSQTLASNGLVAREGWVGVSATQGSRTFRDVRGQDFRVEIEIRDDRPAGGKARGPYSVTVMLEGVSMVEMNMGASPIVGVTETFSAPGTYSLSLLTPRSRSTAVVAVTMTDEAGMTYRDEFSVSFHVHFYRLLKWAVALPLIASSVALLLLGRQEESGAQIPEYQMRKLD